MGAFWGVLRGASSSQSFSQHRGCLVESLLLAWVMISSV